jgi:replicative DNA helicase
VPRQAATPATPDRAARHAAQAARAASGAQSAATSARAETQFPEGRGGQIGEGESRDGASEAGLGAATGFERVEGRSAPSRDDRRDGAGVPGKPPAGADSEGTVRPSDVVGLFAAPGRNADEDVVKQLVREIELVQANRLKRKIEVIVTMARASAQQNRSLAAFCEEAHRDVDMQFDELERVLSVRLREAKQAVAARQVSNGATASYLIIAADQHNRRQVRERLERQREDLRRAILTASNATGALNAGPLIGLLQVLQAQVESEIEAQGDFIPGYIERMSTEQMQAIEARRAQALQLISDAWRRIGETQCGLVGMLTEVRQGVEQRFEYQRAQVA